MSAVAFLLGMWCGSSLGIFGYALFVNRRVLKQNEELERLRAKVQEADTVLPSFVIRLSDYRHKA